MKKENISEEEMMEKEAIKDMLRMILVLAIIIVGKALENIL